MDRFQASIQSSIAPAAWIPGLRNVHSEIQEWSFQVDAKTAMEQVWEAAQRLDVEGFVARDRNDKNLTLTIDFLTKAKWLDQMKISFQETSSGKSSAKVFAYSTGFLPMIIPLAPLFNIILFFIPFADGGKCAATMKVLRDDLKSHNVIVKYKVTRKSISNSSKDTGDM